MILLDTNYLIRSLVEGVDLVRAFLRGNILPFTDVVAAESARLYDAAGRHCRLRIAATIAATVVTARARLATANSEDFRPFVEFGLVLV